jgi:hypothetical protein
VASTSRDKETAMSKPRKLPRAESVTITGGEVLVVFERTVTGDNMDVLEHAARRDFSDAIDVLPAGQPDRVVITHSPYPIREIFDWAKAYLGFVPTE